MTGKRYDADVRNGMAGVGGRSAVAVAVALTFN